MTMTDWHDKLVHAEQALGLNGGFRFVYGPACSLHGAQTAFLSLNPGRAPAQTVLRQLTDERGNSYEVERQTTLSPLTEQALRTYAFFNVAPKDTMTGVVCPFRTDGWRDLDARSRQTALSLGREFWSTPLAQPSLKLIICCGGETARAVVEWTGARLERTGPSGWGNIMIHRYRTKAGADIVALPHLSHFKLFGRPQSEQAIRTLMG